MVYFQFFVLACVLVFTPYYMYIGFKFFIHYYFIYFIVEMCVKLWKCKLLIFK